MEIKLELSQNDAESDRSAILDPLVRFNNNKTDDPAYLPLNVLIRANEGAANVTRPSYSSL